MKIFIKLHKMDYLCHFKWHKLYGTLKAQND